MALDTPFNIDVEFSPGEVAIQNFEFAESPIDTGDSSEFVSLGKRLASRAPARSLNCPKSAPHPRALIATHALQHSPTLSILSPLANNQSLCV
jgi:hypothetical protein